MKTPARTIAPSFTLRPSLRLAFLWTCIAGFAIGSGATAHADSSTWTNTAGGNWNWSDSTNWSLSTPADGVGSTASLTANIIGTSAIFLDSSRTLGALYIGDSNSSNYYTLTATNGATLTLDNGGAGAQISQTSTGKTSVINAPIIMNDDLTISNAATVSGATMTLSGSISSTGGTRNLTIKANGTGSGTGLTFSGAINNVGTITNNGTGIGTVAFNGSIGSNVTDVIQNSSTSTLDLTGTNSFTGNLKILSGTAMLGANAKAAGDNTIILGSGAADATLLSGHSTGATYTNAISVEAGSGARMIDNNSGNTRTFTGNITLANDLTVKSRGTAGYAFTLSGNISGTGNISFVNNTGNLVLSGSSINSVGTISNTGTNAVATTLSGAIGSNVTKITQNGICGLLLSGSNTAFAGSVEVVSGFLKTGGTNALNSNNAVAVGTSGTFDINNYNVTIAGLNDGVGAGTVTNSGLSAKVLTLGGTGNYSFGGVITATTPANLALTKIATGTQTLTGTSTYTGATSVNAGKLAVSGNLASTSGVTVASAAELEVSGFVNQAATLSISGKLAGSGTVGKVQILAGASVMAGLDTTGVEKIATLTTGDFTLASTSSVNFDLTAGNTTIGAGINDLIAVDGNLTLDGVLNINVNGGSLSAGRYTLFTYTGTLTDNTLDLSSSFLSTYAGSYIDTTSATRAIELVVVPEPSTWAICFGGLGMLIMFGQYRNRMSA